MRHDRGPIDRATDEVWSWVGDKEAERRREMDKRRERGPGPRGEGWPDTRDYRLAGETILGRADWGDRESDYAHGFRAFRGEPEPLWRAEPPAWGDVPPGYEGPGVVRREPVLPDYSGRGPRNYRRSDQRILEDVCDRLTDDPRVDAVDIDVRVKDGEVMLTGTVGSRDEKRRAEDVAELAGGVRDIVNELRVNR